MLEYIVDFYCHEIQLAIEVDGDSHEYKYAYDSKRQGKLEKLGVEFIRFTDHEVKNNMFSVGLALEEKVGELLGIHAAINTPLTPPSRGESLQGKFDPTEPTPPFETEIAKDIPFQVGVTVPKKNFKSAVKRNQIKRLLRESYRTNKPLLFNNSKANFAFLFLYLGKEIPKYREIESDMKAILQKFLKQMNDE